MMFITNPHRYTGHGDTTVSYSGFEQQYWEYYHAALDTTQLLTLDSLRGTIKQRLQQNELPLVMLAYAYNEFLPTAAQDHLITIDSANAQVFDGPDLSLSPYSTGQLFSAVLPVPVAEELTSFALYVGSEFWLGNTPAPDMLLLDFGDGFGPREVRMGSTIQVQLAIGRPSTTGPGGVAPVPRLSDGATVVVTNPDRNLSAAITFRTTKTTASIVPDVALGLLAGRNWPGFTPTRGVYGPNGRATAIAWIKYADSNTSGKLRRPLVFVEGIDFSKIRGKNIFFFYGIPNHPVSQTGPLPLADFQVSPNPLMLFGGYRNGSAGWNEVVDYNEDFPELEKFPAMRERLQAPPTQSFPDGSGGDYDLIYLDFSDGATLIQQNAMVLVELLQWINDPANRTSNAEETVVIGASMGGQVSRFALSWMEQQGLCHNSKLWVSFDSPHRGANISLGIQHMFDRLQGVWIGAGAAQDAVQNKLLREATMQMVLFHFNLDAAPYRQQWQNWQTSAGSYPSLLRKVAIANGSGQAVAQPGMFPGMELLRTAHTASVFVAGPNFAYALPGTSSLGHDNVVFRYHKPYTLHDNYRYSYCDPTWSYFDQAPGSFRRTSGDAEEQGGGNLEAAYPSQTFMATISALDVQDAGGFTRPNLGYDVRLEIPNRDRPNRAKYAFDAYFAAGGTNEPHIQLTNGQASTHQGNDSYYTDNSAWIRNELRESAHLLSAALAAVYNYGSPYRHLLPSVQVNSGGVLYLNNGTLPASGGTAATQMMPDAGNFEVYTSNCQTVVQVNSGGQLLVGTTSTHTAWLRMAANSLLDLRAGSQTTVSQGSMLRIVPGATLVVRRGATLTLNGLLVVDAGGYLCLEDPASLVMGATGQQTLSQQAHYFANPALNLSGLACQSCLRPGYLVINGSLQQPAGTCAPGSAVFTITDQQGTQPSYAWQVNQGTIASGQGTDQITVTGLPFQTYTLQVHVSAPATCAGAADVTQDLTQPYYTRSPDGSFCLNDGDGGFALYPNPAGDQVEVHLSQPAGSGRAAAPLTVRLYDAYGQFRAEQTSQGEPVLRLSTHHLPSGLYFVQLLREGQVLGRQQLKIAR